MVEAATRGRAETVGPAQSQPEAGERFYLPELDILRFFAFLAVFTTHVANRSLFALNPAGLAGSFGVDLFFALSSYLITRLLLREQQVAGHVDVRAFYVRRILRIWPLYFFYLGLVFCVSRLIYAHGSRVLVASISYISPGYFLTMLLLCGNFAMGIWGEVGLLLSPLWSLCVEEQFYLVWPQTVRRASRATLVAIAVGMLVVSIVARLIAPMLGYRGVPVWLFTFTRLDPIAAGILLALAPASLCTGLGRTSRAILVLLGVACWWFAAAWCNVRSPVATTLQMGLGYPASALGSVAFLAAALGAGDPNSQFLLKRWLIYLGKISYGLYVYHGFVISMTRYLDYELMTYWQSRLGSPPSIIAVWLLYIVGSFSLTVIVASCSYRWLEAPFLRLKRRFTTVASRPV
jgi:peptidoglycan/LPS O-acetylase OafA/YrhL